MLSSHRVRVALAGLVLVSTSACFEMEQTLVVKANGKASLAQSLSFTEGFAAVATDLAKLGGQAAQFEDLRAGFDLLDDADKAMLKKNKVKLTRNATAFPADGLPTIDIAAKVKSIAALDYVSLATGDKEKSQTRRVRLERLDDGNVRLIMLPPTPPGGGKTESTEAEAETEAPDIMESDPEAAMELMGVMMAESQKLSMVQRVTVPGTVVSATPDVGLSLDGDTATWSLDVSTLMGAADKFADPEKGFQVVFTPEGKLAPSLFE